MKRQASPYLSSMPCAQVKEYNFQMQKAYRSRIKIEVWVRYHQLIFLLKSKIRIRTATPVNCQHQLQLLLTLLHIQQLEDNKRHIVEFKIKSKVRIRTSTPVNCQHQLQLQLTLLHIQYHKDNKRHCRVQKQKLYSTKKIYNMKKLD